MVRVTITQKMYGWSKWGGGNHGLVKEELDTWYCQGCSELQRKGLPSYMVELATREFARVCAKCKHEMVVKRINSYWKLIGWVQGRRGQDDINLQTC